MADWFGEWNIARILAQAKRSALVDVKEAEIPPYLLKRRAEVEMRSHLAGWASRSCGHPRQGDLHVIFGSGL